MMELHEVVAENARARRFTAEVAVHEWRHNRFFKLILEIEHVKRHAEMGGNSPRVPDVVDRTAASGSGNFGFRGFFPGLLRAGCATLIPQLHGQADDLLALVAQQ